MVSSVSRSPNTQKRGSLGPRNWLHATTSDDQRETHLMGSTRAWCQGLLVTWMGRKARRPLPLARRRSGKTQALWQDSGTLARLRHSGKTQALRRPPPKTVCSSGRPGTTWSGPDLAADCPRARRAPLIMSSGRPLASTRRAPFSNNFCPLDDKGNCSGPFAVTLANRACQLAV